MKTALPHHFPKCALHLADWHGIRFAMAKPESKRGVSLQGKKALVLFTERRSQ